MFISKKIIDKIITLRLTIGDTTLSQNLNMTLSHYGINLKELKSKLDSLTDNLPKGLTLYFYFFLYKNNTYDILLKGPTFSACISFCLNDKNEENQNYIITLDDVIVFYKLKNFISKKLQTLTSFFFFSKKIYYKQLLGIVNSFKTI